MRWRSTTLAAVRPPDPHRSVSNAVMWFAACSTMPAEHENTAVNILQAVVSGIVEGPVHPALVAAGGYEAATSANDIANGVGWMATGMATMVSFVVAYASIAWLVRFVSDHLLRRLPPSTRSGARLCPFRRRAHRGVRTTVLA